ncbi:uncharacterized protein LOC119480340 [Sebastes umbrosus]|uniref:uncharacterized protein LOC119480340 n=1 Tax=Sebastes umbrosus TaxID=72105 RepID=UPI0018A0A636|nr:uncharacterized protein LOC119480340 [Sebastes umbrosus]
MCFCLLSQDVKMICSILLLLSLTSCVSGAFVVNVKQTSYQAEKNHNITLEWMFTTRTHSSPKSLFIYCELFAEPRPLVLFHLLGGVEDPESQDKQFAGRVRCDKDVLRDGRLRLHMSRLRIDDSGVYRCNVLTGDGTGSEICHLDVTAAADEPKPPTPTMRPPTPERHTMRPQPKSWEKITLSVALITVLGLVAGYCFAVLCKPTRSPRRENNGTDVQSSLELPNDGRLVLEMEKLISNRGSQDTSEATMSLDSHNLDHPGAMNTNLL